MNIAASAHKGQVRRYDNEPYINHPIRVAATVSFLTDDSRIIIAALLHDTVEDTNITLTDISHMFGLKVALIVQDLTSTTTPEKDGNRKRRKELDLLRLKTACQEAKMIKAADLLDNGKAIFHHDPKFSPIYAREWEDILEEIQRHVPSSIIRESRSLLNGYREKEACQEREVSSPIGDAIQPR